MIASKTVISLQQQSAMRHLPLKAQRCNLLHVKMPLKFTPKQRTFSTTTKVKSSHDYVEGFTYRASHPPVGVPLIGKIYRVIQWTSMWYLFWHYPQLLFEAHYAPNPKHFTDEELGIPPIDYDEVWPEDD